MKRNKKRNHSPEFKAKVGLEALMGADTVSEIAKKYEIHPTQVSQWKSELKQGLPGVFDKKGPKKTEASMLKELDDRNRKIGELSMELDWLQKKSKELGL